MSRLRKRLNRLRNKKEAKWDEVAAVLRHFRFEVDPPPGGGSHWGVYHPLLDGTLTVSVHGNRVTRPYIDKIILAIEEIDVLEEEQDEEDQHGA